MKNRSRLLTLAIAMLLLGLAPTLALAGKGRYGKNSLRIHGNQLTGPIRIEYFRPLRLSAMAAPRFSGLVQMTFKCRYKSQRIHLVYKGCRNIQEAEALANMLTRAVKKKKYSFIDVWKPRRVNTKRERYMVADLQRWQINP